MTLIRAYNKARFALNKRKHVKKYPYISMVVLHHFFTVFGIDIIKLDEKSVSPPKDATTGESLPVHIYNAIYNDASYLKYIDILEANIKALYKENNEWCLWMVNLFDMKVRLNKNELQEVALLSHESLAEDYITWQLKVNEVISELVVHIELTLNSNKDKNRNKRKRKKKRS